MELHKAIKEIVEQQGADIIKNIQVINFLLDYRAFTDKPATKLILRDIINSGYAEEILALKSNVAGWQTKFNQYEHEFIDACGYKEELATYVFESIAYAIGLGIDASEPTYKPHFNVDSFFSLPTGSNEESTETQVQTTQQPDPVDLYTIALSFYNEGKYQQAKGFIDKALSSAQSPAPSLHLKLMAEILLKTGDFATAIGYYNECFKSKAQEAKMSIDNLRNALTNHEVKGYENCMFNYFFCLYHSGQIADSQWLPFVKKEAIYGLLDAIQYCADNGINPVDSHFDIYFTELSELRSGDFLYSDGTFAHEKSVSKVPIAKVKLVETDDFEKKNGWTHGYIIPLETIKGQYKWSLQNEDLSFPHSHYTVDDLNHWDKANKINSEHFISIDDYNAFPAFKAVEDFHIKIPILGTSPWFLPNILLLKKISYAIEGYYCWTSSQADKNNAILFTSRYWKSGKYGGYLTNFEIRPKSSEWSVLPIAVFLHYHQLSSQQRQRLQIENQGNI